MSKKEIRTPHVKKPIGPWVQGVEVTGGKLIFTAGYAAQDMNGRIVGAGDVAQQTRHCLESIRHVIEAAGGTLADLVKISVFLTDPKNYDAMNAVRREVLKDIAFVSTSVITALPPPAGADALIEIDAVAVVKG